MIQIIAEIVPLAIGIAINPIAIIAFIALLSSRHGQLSGIGLVCGWMLALSGLTALGAAVTIRQQQSEEREPTDTAAWMIAVFGIGMIVMAFVTWFRRPVVDDALKPPRWIQEVSRLGVVQAFCFGAFLVLFSFKNLTLAPAAGAIIAAAKLEPAEYIVLGFVFVTMSTLGILVPLAVSVFGGGSSSATLERWRVWLIIHNSTATTCVLLAVGTHLLRTGLSGM